MITYTVTTLTDESDAGATVAVPGGTGLSLREAIALANANAGADAIIFAAGLSGGTIRLTNAAGTLLVTDALQIDGDFNNDGKADIKITGDAGGDDPLTPDGYSDLFAGNAGDNVRILSATADLSIDGLVLTGGGKAGSSATQTGGAIQSTANLTLTHSVVSGNYALNAGAGIHVTGGLAMLTGVTVSHNHAGLFGGGLYADNATLTNVTFHDNQAGNNGGAIYGTTLSLTNGTIAGNSAGNVPGIETLSSVTLVNSIVMGNTSNSGPQVRTPTLTKLGGNIIGTDVFSGGFDIGNTTLSEVFLDVGSTFSGQPILKLADNGVSAPTIALNPATTNPALDKSNTDAPATDARGFIRVDHGTIPNLNGSEADLGAFEARELASLVVTTLNDVVDDTDNLTSLREAIAYANIRSGEDIITFAPGLSGGTIRLTNAAGSLVVTGSLKIDGDINNNGSPDITITGDKNANDVTTAGGITDVFATSFGNLADNVKLFDATGMDLTIEGLVLTGGASPQSGNNGEEYGGAIKAGSLTLLNAVISGNTAYFGGGGVYAQNVTATNTTVSGNSATYAINATGGGIFAESAATLTNTTISGNVAQVQGGGVAGNSVTLLNTTVSGNRAISIGGAVSATAVTLTNSIVMGNVAPSDPEVRHSNPLTLSGGNIIGTDVFSGSTDVGNTTLAAVFASVTFNSANVQSGTLADNGGGKPTIALKGSFTNPALDASNGVAPATDEAGMGRVNQPAPNPNGFVADLGAKELAPYLPVVTGTSGDDSYAQPGSDTRIDAGGGTDTITFSFKLTEATVFYVDNTTVIFGPNNVHTQLSGFEVFTFTDGTVNNNDGDVLVDDLYYYTRNHDVWNAHADADAHFHSVGWREGRNPDVFFSTQFYFALYPDARGTDPLVHFDQIGWKTGRLSSVNFDPFGYLAANPDVKAAGVDPLAHYLASGASEGRLVVQPTELIAPNGFDTLYYLRNNPDVAASGVNPFQHFQQFGWKEGRNPNALFDVKGYLNTYTDVKAGGMNPLDHYNLFGWKEGRDPSVNFDTTAYLDAYADIKAAGINPLNHFLDFGIHEGRSPFADGVWG